MEEVSLGKTTPQVLTCGSYVDRCCGYGEQNDEVWEEQVWREHGGQRWCQGLGREGVETVWANHVTAIDCLSQNSWWEGL